MYFQTLNIVPAAPEIFVLLMACIILLVGAFFKKSSSFSYFASQFTLIGAAVITWVIYYKLNVAGIVITFHQMFILDRLSTVLKLFIYLVVFVTFLYSRQYNDERRIPSNEFYVLGLLSTFGMMILVSSHNFLVLFLGLELVTLPIYAMVALQRSKERCIEAAMKYFIIGALASGLLLYGMSLLFGATKSLDISQISLNITQTPIQQNLVMLFALVFILAGIAFKFGAAPFHMWVPDVYDGSPSSVTLFLSTAPKLAAFGMTIRLLVQAMPSLNFQWSEILIAVAILSMAIGNFAAIVQTNIKRMLAYSSIAHMGYMILGLACATDRGFAAAMFYIISYSIMTLGGFGMIILMAKAGFEANMIEDFAGLNDRNPWLAFIMMLIMFSMAGVPPIVGFIAKVGIIEALIQANFVWLAVIAVLFAIIGAYYYIRVVKVMYFDKASNMEAVKYSGDMRLVMSLNGIAVFLLGVFPGALFALCHMTF